jgi:membrane fusion protein, multidrug efflux system
MIPRRRSVLALCLTLGVLAASALSAGGCLKSEARQTPAAAAPEAIEVPAVEARVIDIAETLTISGSLVPQTRVEVRSKLPGRLERVLVTIGDRVAAGQVIASLDAREIDTQVDAADAAVNVAKAALASAEASLSNATLELDRARNLFERGALPRQRLDAADTAHRAAVAQRDLAQANLAQSAAAARRAREVRRDATLVSPIAGVIVQRNVDPGNLIGPGDSPIVAVADTRVLKLEAGVAELDAGRLRVGMPARVAVQARPGETYEGRLAALAPEIDAKNRHFRVELRVPNPNDQLLSGMYATARIETARAEGAVTVPREAIGARDGRRVALRISDGRVEPVPVTEGIVDTGRVQVLSGLAGGDLLVADARRTLAPGTLVRPVRQK